MEGPGEDLQRWGARLSGVLCAEEGAGEESLLLSKEGVGAAGSFYKAPSSYYLPGPGLVASVSAVQHWRLTILACTALPNPQEIDLVMYWTH